MQQPYNNQYPPQQPQQPQYQQAPQAPQQPYQQPQYQQAPHQSYQQPAYQPSGSFLSNLTSNSRLLGLIMAMCFGAAALFALIALIGFCVKLTSHAGMIVSYIVAILGCLGIALAPFFNAYTKLCVTASSAALFLGMYGVSMIGLSGSFGYIVLALGFACLAALCWLSYTNNNLVNVTWFVAAPVIFLGAMLNWIIEKYFSMMKWALVFYLFDLLFALAVVGGAVVLGLYLRGLQGVQSAKPSIPNPASRAPRAPQYPPQQPQQPQYQQAPQAPQQPQYQPQQQYQQPQQPQQPQYQQAPQAPQQPQYPPQQPPQA